MTQEEVLAVIREYPLGVLFKDIKAVCINPGTSLTYLYKHREIDRRREGKDFRYWIKGMMINGK